MNEQGTHIDLFSGIGGFALAARWTGFRTVAFCECEPYAQRVLRKHWPDVPIHDDVRTFPGERYAGASLLTGGFPCQPFSLAGKRAGSGDDRFLWPAMVAVIEAVRPAWIIGENVPGIIGMELDRCLSDLEAEGYESWPVVIPACAVDAKHRRDRVWIVAYRKQPRLQGHAGNGEDRNEPGRFGTEARGSTGEGGVCGDVAHTSGGQDDGRERGSMAGAEGQGRCVHAAADAGGEDVADTMREQWDGRSDGPCRWEREPLEALQDARRGGRQEDGLPIPESLLGRVAHGVPARVDRLRGLGNAIVPQVAAELMRMICTANAEAHGRRSRTVQPLVGHSESGAK
jgi:DNA (cytosine-5)-methyltransferase 1